MRLAGGFFFCSVEKKKARVVGGPGGWCCWMALAVALGGGWADHVHGRGVASA